VIALDLANAAFIVCAAVAGLLLVVGLVLDDEIGPILDFLRLRRAVRGVPFVVYVLAFVFGFGAGGLFGTAGMNAEALPAAGVGLLGGLLGLIVAWGLSNSRDLRKVSAGTNVDLDDLVGHRGRLSMDLRRQTLGTVSLTYRGREREFPATADADIPEGTVVVVDDVDETNSTLFVTPASATND
jgi:hypothetical protein